MQTASLTEPLHVVDCPQETAPDGSLVRPLLQTSAASQCHCTLGAGQVSQAIAHREIAELWYCLSGTGEFYCEVLNHQEPFTVAVGTTWHVPPGKAFQFRNTSTNDLTFLITTLPPWPGEEEADLQAEGVWTV
ncbi:MAG: cupin domain-containing protein [Pseudomonadota bacterium]